jgi:TPR repeat protein
MKWISLKPLKWRGTSAHRGNGLSVRCSAAFSALALAIGLLVSAGAQADARKAQEAYKRHDYAGVMAACREVAGKGEPNCQNELGNLYRYGWGVPVNHPEALRWYRAAADQQHAWARVNLGHMLRMGLGTQADPVQALQLFEAAARQGHAHALNAIGDLHANGQGLPTNRTKACEFFEQSAQKGDGWGMVNQAHCLRDGVGGKPRNYPAAFALAQKAALEGNPGGMVLMGTLVRLGQGTQASAEQAEQWYQRALEQPSRLPWVLQPAHEGLGALHYLPKPVGLGPDFDKARVHYEKAAELGSVAGLSGLGAIYRQGTPSVPKDFDKALDYYQRALRQSQSTGAYVGIALMVLNGQGVPADPEKARGYLARAFQLGSGEARFHLARLYESGRGVGKDLAVAKWYMQDALRLSSGLHPTNRKTAEAFLQTHAAVTPRDPGPLQALTIDATTPALTTMASGGAGAATPATPAAAPLAVVSVAAGTSPLQAVRPPAANRKALVIGNDQYRHVDRLNTAAADARAMSRALELMGYRVWSHFDVDERQFKQALRDFKLQLEGGDEALLFFAGHGVQIAGANYLLPIDIRNDSEEQVRDESIQLQRVLDDLNEKKARFSLAIIDACRNNPFTGKGRSIGGRGLAPTTAATGQMILFSAGSGQQALDRLGDADRNPNGVFTRVFLQEMQKPGIPVDRVLRNVRSEVVRLARSIGHEQTPALYDQAVGEFYFR